MSGNHYRDYPEVYGLVDRAIFNLEDIKTKERKTYEMKTGSRLFIPHRAAIKIEAQEGTIIIACSPQVDRESKTHRYELK